MKVLITGADGMVGSRLSKFLTRAGHEVIEFEGDIREWNDWSQYISNKQYDFLIHLAALAGVRPSFENPELYFDNNVNGTRNALRFGALWAKKVLYASSSNAYEWWGNPYATTKMMNEVQAQSMDNAIGMRFHTVWPGRDDMLFRKFERGEVTYVNRQHYRDFIHVEDLLNAIDTIMQNFTTIKRNQSVCDIGTGHSTPVEEVAKLFNFDGEWRDENPKGERTHTKANNQYLLDLGWTPQYNILIKDHHKDYE